MQIDPYLIPLNFTIKNQKNFSNKFLLVFYPKSIFSYRKLFPIKRGSHKDPPKVFLTFL